MSKIYLGRFAVQILPVFLVILLDKNCSRCVILLTGATKPKCKFKFEYIMLDTPLPKNRQEMI